MKPIQIKKHIFKKHYVRLAYLFGSQAKGLSAKKSDYDIAVLFKKKKGSSFFLNEASGLKDALRKYFPNEVDIVPLNDANSLLKYEAISAGIPLFSEDEKFRIDFEVLSVKEYIDDQYIRDIYTDALTKRLRVRKLT